MRSALHALAGKVATARGVAHKSDIGGVLTALGIRGDGIRVGDDCAALPDGDGHLLFAIEGFVDDFVAADPFFAGFCGVMVNLSDIAAMGGRPLAVVDAVWSDSMRAVEPLLAGLRQAAEVFGVPIVGGHTNMRAGGTRLAVSVLGRANHLITSFDAEPGDTILAAVDLRGSFREPFPYWDAATNAPRTRLRGDLDLLPELADAHLVTAGKDISMAGLAGTVIMLAETSGCGAWIDLDAIPLPRSIPLERFLLAFPSFGFILTARAEHVGTIIKRFGAREIACAPIGAMDDTRRVRLRSDGDEADIWDLSRPFMRAADVATV